MVKKYSKTVVSWLLIFVLFLSPFATNAFALEQNTTGLDAGNYTVTANLYVKAEDNKVLGINAYLTNTALPPKTPVSENATLSVAADGEMTLKLNELNNVFTLQEIGGSNDAEIVKETFTDDIQWPEEYTGEKKISSRISTLEIKLKQGVDKYVFSNCKEYPTLLAGTNLEGYWNVPLTLEVDFDSAYIPFDENAEGIQTYSISNNDVTVAVETSDEQMKGAMNTASLSATYAVDKDTIIRLLKEKYDSEPSYTAYTLAMNPDFVGNTRATVTLPTALTTAMHVYRLNNNDTLSEVGYYQWNSNTTNVSANTENITYNAENKTISFTVPQLGTYIVLDTKNNYEYQTVEYPDAGNGVSYKMTDSTRWTTNKTSYVLAKYVEDKNIKPIAPKIEAVGDIGTAYSVGFTSKNEPYYLATQFSSKRDNTIDVPCYKLELTVPGDENTKAYFITKDGQMFSPASLGAEKLPCTVSNGKVVITICEATDSETMDTALNRIELMEQNIKTDCVASNTGLSDMTGYVLVTDKEIAGMPITKVDGGMKAYKDKYLTTNALVYSGSVQDVSSVLQNTNSDVVFSGLDNLKNAGNYSATAELPEGKYWADGTQGDKTIDLIVRQKKLKAEYKGEVIRVGEEPALKMTSKTSQGWKTADKALRDNADYQPTLTAPSELKVGHYTLAPELPKSQSDNYYWELIPGTLTVLPEGAELTDQLVEIPTAITGLTYNGKEQTGVADPDENAGYTITDNKKTEAGTYKAVATLKDGYWWMDGTKEPKTIEWTIAEKKQPVVSDKDKTETVTANLFVPGELNAQLPGVTAYLTNGNNPNGEGGYAKKAPTEPVYNNAKLTTHADGTRTLVLEVPNPVFTLQKLDGAPDGVSVSDYETAKCASAPNGTRISKVTIELPSSGDTFTFEDCEEYPTLLSTTWTVPLTLKLGKNGLDSKSDVDTGSVGGNTAIVKTDLTVKVKDDTATVSKINTDDLSSKNSITLDVTDGNKGVTGVNLPVSALEKIVDAKVPGTTLTLSDTSAKFDLAALTEVTKAASGKTVDLRILTGTDAEKKFSAAEKSAMTGVKNASAVSVALSSDDKAITGFGSGKLTVSVPYKWDGKGAVRAYQVDANGKLVSVPVTCKNNVAELTLTGTGNFILGTVDTKSFDDVADDAFYKTAVDWAVENGVTSGVSDTLFAPDKTCTRAQVVTFLWRASGSPEPTKTENPFTDVKSDAYYYKAVLWALEKGITSGTSATTFAPEAVVSRAQVVTFQWRMAGSPKATGTNNFTDVPADSYYKDAVQWAVDNNITTGTSATTFAPNAGCTRGQIVTFLYRQLGK